MKNLSALALTALIAAVSSVICARLQIPVWIMFIGWIGFIAGGAQAKTALPTYVSVILGAILGGGGALIISSGGEGLGDLFLLIGVFVIVLVALLAQFIPFANAVIGYFVGMTTFFASGLPIQMSTWIIIAAGIGIGIASGLGASLLSARLSRANA